MNEIIFTIVIGLLLGYISTKGTKSQNIRLLDILIIGPLMIYFGVYTYNIFIKDKLYYKCIASIILMFFGSTTITYNLKNYINYKSE
jgi:hypothetical protein